MNFQGFWRAFAGAMLLFASSAFGQNLFVSDDANQSIVEITPGGVKSTFASGLNDPQGLAFNSAGDLFVADSGSGNIYEFTRDGARTNFASGLAQPGALAFDNAGNLYVAAVGVGNICKFTPAGVQSTFATGLPHLAGLAFDSSNNLFVALSASNTIREITPAGMKSTWATGLYDPQGLAFDQAGNLYIANFSEEIITVNGSQDTFATVYDPGELAFDTASNLFVGELNGYLVEIAPDGKVNNFASLADNGSAPFLAFQPPRPALKIAMAGNRRVLISWPSPSTGYVLEQSLALVTTNWALNTNTVSVTGGTNQVTIFPATNSMLYRLANPI